MSDVQENPKLGTGEKIVNAIGNAIVVCIATPIAWVIRLFKRK